MRTQRNHESDSIDTLRLWTYAEARNATPYLRTVATSLREHWLKAQDSRLRVQRIDARAGRPDRQTLILRAEAVEDAERAQADYEEAMGELKVLDIESLDPVQGIALIPFGIGKDLAEFVFDLFAQDELEAWRFDTDPPDARWPLAGTFSLALTPSASDA